ncbi:hypothetical protein Aperf_G00000032117 [Anoplocephala perfoliata]
MTTVQPLPKSKPKKPIYYDEEIKLYDIVKVKKGADHNPADALEELEKQVKFKKATTNKITANHEALQFKKKIDLGTSSKVKNLPYPDIKAFYQFSKSPAFMVLGVQANDIPKQYIFLAAPDVNKADKFAEILQQAHWAPDNNLKNEIPEVTIDANDPDHPDVSVKSSISRSRNGTYTSAGIITSSQRNQTQPSRSTKEKSPGPNRRSNSRASKPELSPAKQPRSSPSVNSSGGYATRSSHTSPSQTNDYQMDGLPAKSKAALVPVGYEAQLPPAKQSRSSPSVNSSGGYATRSSHTSPPQTNDYQVDGLPAKSKAAPVPVGYEAQLPPAKHSRSSPSVNSSGGYATRSSHTSPPQTNDYQVDGLPAKSKAAPVPVGYEAQLPPAKHSRSSPSVNSSGGYATRSSHTSPPQTNDYQMGRRPTKSKAAKVPVGYKAQLPRNQSTKAKRFSYIFCDPWDSTSSGFYYAPKYTKSKSRPSNVRRTGNNILVTERSSNKFNKTEPRRAASEDRLASKIYYLQPDMQEMSGSSSSDSVYETFLARPSKTELSRPRSYSSSSLTLTVTSWRKNK